MASPSPVPPPTARSPRVKRWNTRSRSSGAMPGPSSLTSTTILSPHSVAAQRTRPRRAGCAARRCPAGSPAPGARGSGRRARRAAAADVGGEAHAATGDARRDLGLRHRLAHQLRHRDGARGRAPRRPRRSATGPAARRPVGRGAGSGRARSRAWRDRRVATPSTRFSSTACSAAIGVRSSCETFAISSRRCWSAAARSAAIWLNATASWPDLVAGRGPHPPRVVALRHRAGRGGHRPQRPGHPVREHLRGEQHDRHRDQRDPDRRLPPVLVVEVGEPGRAGGQQQDADLELDRATGSSGRGSRSTTAAALSMTVIWAPPTRTRRRARCGSGPPRACGAVP